MAKDPGFIFYPGDYLRDTQVLSEAVQVAYDRIMCEHMRNICISYEQLKFFTKKLNADEVSELKAVLVEEKGKGFYIEWVRLAIEKRREYSKSRAKNRIGASKKKSKPLNNISASYDSHMENEIDNENEIEKGKRKRDFKPPSPEDVQVFVQMEGFPLELGVHVYKYYNDAGWKDSTGKKVKNWKQKIRGVWLKEENRNYGKQSTSKTGTAANSRLENSIASAQRYHAGGNG